MKKENLHTCPECGQENFSSTGLKKHQGNKRCLATQSEMRTALMHDALDGEVFRAALDRLPATILRQAADHALLHSDHRRHNLILPHATAKEKAAKALTVIDGQVTVIPPGGEIVAPHNQYHRNGMMAAAQSVCWLVLTGMELVTIKKGIPHGGWEEWVSANCEYSVRTAQKYMALADGVAAKLKAGGQSKTNRGSFLELLETAPSALTPEQQAALLKHVHEITDERTIKELYLDFGIIKAPAPPAEEGDAKPQPTHEEALTKLLNDTREWVDDVLTGPLKSKHWRLLEDTENIALASHFEEQAKAIREWLSAPKKERSALALEDLL